MVYKAMIICNHFVDQKTPEASFYMKLSLAFSILKQLDIFKKNSYKTLTVQQHNMSRIYIQ